MTDGVDFVGGLASGIDTRALIDSMLAIQSVSIDRLQDRKDGLQADHDAWTAVTAQLIAMQVQSFILSRDTTFETKQALSSDTDAFTATANSTAASATYDIEVVQMATSHQIVSKGYDDTDVTTVGAGTITIEQSGGFIDPQTRLDFLNAQTGVGRSSIKITDKGGTAATIDLSTAVTIQDVIDTINANTTANVLASINKYGTGINITDQSGGGSNLIITDIGGGTAASDLGIATTTTGTSDSYVLGSIIMKLDGESDLDSLNDGLGVRSGTVKFTLRDNSTVTVTVDNDETLQDVIDNITAGANLTGAMNADGTGLQVTDASSGGANKFYAFSDTDQTTTDSALSAGDTTISVASASAYQVGDRIQILDAANNNVDFRTITAVDKGSNNITVSIGVDNGYASGVTVSNANTLHDLGLEFNINTSDTLKEGKRLVTGMNSVLSKLLNGGSDYDDGSVDITDKAGDVATANLSHEVSTTLNGAIGAAGATNFTVTSAADFRVGDRIRLIEGSTTEYRTITAITGSGTSATQIHVDQGLSNTYSNGITVYTRIETAQQVIDRLNTAKHATALNSINNGAGVAAGQADAIVDDGSVFSVGDMVVFQENGHQEIMEISSISTNTLTFTTNFENAYSDDVFVWKTTDITASINDASNGIKIKDNSGASASNLIVAEDATDNAAAGLGIEQTITSGTILDGTDLDHQWQGENTRLDTLNFGEGIFSGRITITDRNNASATIDLRSSTTMKTLGDVITAINAASVSVTASINATGDGLLITDDTGGANSLVIAEVDGGTTGKDLNIIVDTTAASKDGARESSITVTSTMTLDDIRSEINSLDIPVSATIINDGAQANPFKLLITSEETGTQGQVVIDANLTGGRGLEFSDTSAAKDAAILIGSSGGGASAQLVVKSSNQITDALQGVTLNLLQETTSAKGLTVSDNFEGIISAVQDFVDTWNNTMELLNLATSYDPTTEQSGELLGDSSILTITRQMTDIITGAVSGVSSQLNTLVQAGITLGLTGSMELNTDTLEEALREDLSMVKDLFGYEQNMALNSLGNTITASATPFATSTGAVDGENNDNAYDDVSFVTGWKSTDDADSTTLTYEIQFANAINLSRLKVFMLDTTAFPANTYSLEGYKFEYFDTVANAYQTHTTITGNNLGTLSHHFDREQYTTKVRLTEISMTSKADQKARIVEIEAYQKRGIASRLNELMLKITNAGDGIIARKQEDLKTSIDQITERQDDLTEIIEIRRTRLIREFAAMEAAVQEGQNTSAWLVAQLPGLNAAISN